MRAMWRGSISFGLINVPIKMYAATERKGINFRQIHKVCGMPIHYEKVCSVCGRKVQDDEIARGYEFEKGKYVIIDDRDLESIPDENARTIDIIDFVNLADIDPIYYDRSYFLGPEETGQKAYILLRKAMEEGKKIAIAKMVMRSKQSLACIRPYGKEYLVMETMFYPDEVRNVNEVPTQPQAKIQENEVKMAVKLVDSLSGKFDASKYTDDYRQALLDVINKKVENREISIPQQREEKVIDLMQALKASLELAEKENKKGAKKGKKKAGKKAAGN